MSRFESQITFCYTDNLQRTSEWYQRVLGLELVLDQGKCHIFRAAGQSFIGFCERDSVGINHDDVILTFVTDEVDGWYDRLRSSGAIVVGKPESNEAFGLYHFFARDPNGYRIEIQRFLSAKAREVCHKKGKGG
jgi:catechol 2,3-dioxygenase-like lactoylglutathione lyase family enzyme